MDRFRRALAFALAVVLLGTGWAQAAPLEWRPVGVPPAEPVATSIAYGAGRFVRSEGERLLTSTDGVTWSPVPVDDQYRSLSVFYTGREFVAIGCGVRCDSILTSADGLSWETRYRLPGRVSSLAEIAYGNGRYVVRFDGSAEILSSADLAEWTSSTAGLPLSSLVFGRGQFVGVSWEGVVLASSDGVVWTEVFRADQPISITSMAYGGGRFVAVGYTESTPQRAVVLSSADGQSWQLRLLEEPPRLVSVTYAGGQFIASGEDKLAVSADGAEWTFSPSPMGQAMWDLAYGAGRFVAVGRGEPVRIADVCGALFDDVPAGTPWCDAVEELAARGIVRGVGPRAYGPEQPLTRAEITTLLVRALGAAPVADQPLPFTDTAGHWAAEQGYLQAALQLGLISGFPDGTFRPDEPVTRAQLVRLAASAAGLTPGGHAPYPDIRAGDWYAGWVAAAHRAGLIGLHVPYAVWGENAAFMGERPVSRAEAAMVLANLLK